jgi:hypothetical protein
MNSNNQFQNDRKYFQNLDAISGMKELSDEMAATSSGGGAWDRIKKGASGYKNYITGELDGLTGQEDEKQKGLPYRAGRRVGQGILATGVVVGTIATFGMFSNN